LATAAACAAGVSLASSHREAPFITTSLKVDGTDFYMFRSYQAVRTDYVTLISNYQGLQDPYGGPNYFKLDPNALYEIHLDNNGDAREDLSFQFRVKNTLASGGKGVELPIGNKSVAIALTQAGAVANVSDANSIQDKNVTSIAIEVHKDCLTAGSDPVIGGWTTASVRQARLLSGAPTSGCQPSEKSGGAWTQVSRLDQPLVNEVVILETAVALT
jgi:hypothetical protein